MNLDWKNSISLFSHTVKVTDNNYVAHLVDSMYAAIRKVDELEVA